MKKINNGGPAFPKPMGGHTYSDGSYEIDNPNNGMSLRDYFAAKAMQAIIMSEQYEKADDPIFKKLLCLEALEYADAMLKARDK